ncbi:MAG: hypothetical protein ACJA10_000068 [Oleispira sp.]|jgi:hypothetical protein
MKTIATCFIRAQARKSDGKSIIIALGNLFDLSHSAFAIHGPLLLLVHL